MSWRHRLRRLLADRGLTVERLPPTLARTPEKKLRADLGLVLDAHRARMAAAGRGPEAFFLVQIGAFDGRSGDPLHDFIVRHRPSGILVEPVPSAFAQLTETYRGHDRLELVQAAVAEQAGERTFYSIRADGPGLPEWAAQLSSLDRDTILKHEREIPDIRERIESRPVACVTFDQLVVGHGVGGDRPIDLLTIDAEGYDWKLLQTVDLDRYRPTIVRYEHQHLSPADRDAAVRYLLEHGYRVRVERADTLGMLG